MAISKPQLQLGKSFGNLGARLASMFEGGMGLDPSRLPLLGKVPAEKRHTYVVTTLVVSLLLAALLMVWYTVQLGNRASYVEISTRLQMLSQRYTKTAQQAVLGNSAAFKQLDDSRQAFGEGLKTLIEGGAGVPSSPAAMQGDLSELQKRWNVSQKDIQAMVSQQKTLVGLSRALAEINQRNAELLDLAEQVISLLPPAATKHVAFANQQALWTQRMAKNANALLSSDQINPETAYQLGQDVRTFREVLTGLIEGNAAMGITAVTDTDAHDKLLELRDIFTAFEKQIDNILKGMPQLVEARRAARELFDESEKVLTITQELTSDYQGMTVAISL
jgi:twitching motility protein PilJ